MKLFSLFAELALDSSKFDKGVKNASSAGRGLASTLKSGIGGAATFVGNKVSATTIMLGNLMADTVKQGAGVIKQLAQTGLDYNAQMETYATNFRTMLGGSAEAAEKLTGDLQEMAASTPFAMTDLADATQTLLAFGQDSETVLDTLQSLGDISMGDANKLQSLTLAFAQASSSGKLMGQDLLQMINAGFNPLQTIVDQTGASMGDLKAFMSDGKASDALKKQMKIAQREVKEFGDQASVGAKILTKMAQEGVISAETLGMIFEVETSPGGKFYGAMEAASKTMTGLFSTLQDDSSALMGKVFTPITNWMKDDLLPDTISLVGEISKAFDEGGLPAAVKTATDKVKGYFGELAPVALDAGSNLLANVLSGITGDTISSESIKSAITGLWSDGEAALTTFKTNAGAVLTGIWNGLTNDSQNKTNISEEVKGLWDEGSKSITAFIGSASGLLGTIYTVLTQQSATSTNIGNTIGGVFKAGGLAAQTVLDTGTTFFGKLQTALGDPNPTLLGVIGGVFTAGTDAAGVMIEGSKNVLSQLYVAVSGDKEGAEKFEKLWDTIFPEPKYFSVEYQRKVWAESQRQADIHEAYGANKEKAFEAIEAGKTAEEVKYDIEVAKAWQTYEHYASLHQDNPELVEAYKAMTSLSILRNNEAKPIPYEQYNQWKEILSDRENPEYQKVVDIVTSLGEVIVDQNAQKSSGFDSNILDTRFEKFINQLEKEDKFDLPMQKFMEWQEQNMKEETGEDNEALSSAIGELSNNIAAMNKEDPTINVNVSVNGNMASLVTAVSSALARGARAVAIGP